MAAIEDVADDTPQLTASQVRKRLVTPFRAVLLAMLVIVLLTVWWAVRARMLDVAARVVQTEREAAHAALEAGDLAEAAFHFRQAWAALKQLGKEDDASSRQTGQLERETHAATNLASQSLMEIVEEAHPLLAAAEGNETAHEEAPRQSLGRHRGNWIVMDAMLTPIAAEDGGTRWIVDYPFAVGEALVEIDAALPIFAPLQTTAAPPQRVLFAGQLEACRLVRGPRLRLVVQLNPDTAFLWKNVETLRLIGLVDDDEQALESTTILLDRQTPTGEASP